MIVVPAIDVRDGRCVRLRQGDFGAETAYADDPSSVADSFIAGGARRLHVVDLDAARSAATAASGGAIRALLALASERGVQVQIGGGVRSVATALDLLDAGASLVVLGTVAVDLPEVALDICRRSEGRVLLALDVRSGAASTHGWIASGGPVDECLNTWRDWPAAGVVYTDVERDGMMGGADIAGLERCREVYPGPVYLSGGVTTSDDIVAAADHGAAGVILGRALYEGRLTLADALRACPVGC